MLELNKDFLDLLIMNHTDTIFKLGFEEIQDDLFDLNIETLQGKLSCLGATI